jgi:alkylation response protein AidB-like acyl-CoA dehydrogenase
MKFLQRPGGSDVSQTETIATRFEPSSSSFSTSTTSIYPQPFSIRTPTHTLTGIKYFSSATDSHIALALARTGELASGARGLSLFLVPVSVSFPHPNTSSNAKPIPVHPFSNGIAIHRLKPKLGTHTLPTAELVLSSTPAYLIGKDGEGVKTIAEMLNVTRLHSACASVSYLGRAIGIARAWADVREVATVKGDGRGLLRENALHLETLAGVEITHRALLSFVLNAGALLGQVESAFFSLSSRVDPARQEQEADLLRLFTPTLKAFTSHVAPTAVEECMVSLGGNGYVEDGSCLPR